MGETGLQIMYLEKASLFASHIFQLIFFPGLLVLYHVKPIPPGLKVAQHFWS